jgi:hypothetical protein
MQMHRTRGEVYRCPTKSDWHTRPRVPCGFRIRPRHREAAMAPAAVTTPASAMEAALLTSVFSLGTALTQLQDSTLRRDALSPATPPEGCAQPTGMPSSVCSRLWTIITPASPLTGDRQEGMLQSPEAGGAGKSSRPMPGTWGKRSRPRPCTESSPPSRHTPDRAGPRRSCPSVARIHPDSRTGPSRRSARP